MRNLPALGHPTVSPALSTVLSPGLGQLPPDAEVLGINPTNFLGSVGPVAPPIYVQSVTQIGAFFVIVPVNSVPKG